MQFMFVITIVCTYVHYVETKRKLSLYHI